MPKKYNYTDDDIIKFSLKCQSLTVFRRKFRRLEIKNPQLYSKGIEIIKNNKCNILKETHIKTIDHIDSIITNYSSITEFRKSNPKLYRFIKKYKINKYDNIFIKQRVSSQQLICKYILEQVLKCKCLYNTRKILNGKELDIYFPQYLLAFEYNGFYWHKNRSSDDINKMELCKNENILLIQIIEKSNNFHNNIDFTISDIKQQIIRSLKNINRHCNLNINPIEIENIDVKYNDLLQDMYGVKDIHYIISKCNRYSEIKTKYNKIWQYLLRSNLLYLLEPVKRRDYIYMNKEEILSYIKSNFPTYSHFVKHKIYQLCRKRGYLDDVKSLY